MDASTGKPKVLAISAAPPTRADDRVKIAVFGFELDDRSANVTGQDAPRPILVPIGGAKRVQLAVDFGEDLDVGDQADWGNVRVVK